MSTYATDPCLALAPANRPEQESAHPDKVNLISFSKSKTFEQALELLPLFGSRGLSAAISLLRFLPPSEVENLPCSDSLAEKILSNSESEPGDIIAAIALQRRLLANPECKSADAILELIKNPDDERAVLGLISVEGIHIPGIEDALHTGMSNIEPEEFLKPNSIGSLYIGACNALLIRGDLQSAETVRNNLRKLARQHADRPDFVKFIRDGLIVGAFQSSVCSQLESVLISTASQNTSHDAEPLPTTNLAYTLLQRYKMAALPAAVLLKDHNREVEPEDRRRLWEEFCFDERYPVEERCFFAIMAQPVTHPLKFSALLGSSNWEKQAVAVCALWEDERENLVEDLADIMSNAGPGQAASAALLLGAITHPDQLFCNLPPFNRVTSFDETKKKTTIVDAFLIGQRINNPFEIIAARENDKNGWRLIDARKPVGKASGLPFIPALETCSRYTDRQLGQAESYIEKRQAHPLNSFSKFLVHAAFVTFSSYWIDSTFNLNHFILPIVYGFGLRCVYLSRIGNLNRKERQIQEQAMQDETSGKLS